ncbi:hypothetical protein NFI96_021675 [Prochilodus magdalenae]|nr:hypothetical protein NFI96_021675 [Prochilodus magdalenae]
MIWSSVQISIQCQDDTYGFNAQVVYEDRTFTLRRCTPFLSIYRRHDVNNLPRESQESSLYGTPVAPGDTVESDDIATDSSIHLSVPRRQAGTS